jgi:hypothetical protein
MAGVRDSKKLTRLLECGNGGWHPEQYPRKYPLQMKGMCWGAASWL